MEKRTALYFHLIGPFTVAGPNCDMDDPCLENKENCPAGFKCYGPCNPNVFCEWATGVPHYTNCIKGWMGDGCASDVNECKCTQFPDICNYNGTCVNLVGSHRCDCNPGRMGQACELLGPSSDAAVLRLGIAVVFVAILGNKLVQH